MKKVIKVSRTAREFIKDVSKLSLKAELESLGNLNTSNIVYGTLSDQQIGLLAKKINLLPQEYRNILFFRYSFNSSPSQTDSILETENSKAKLRYAQKMLSSFMHLENSWIDNDSMGKACQIALREATKDYDNVEVLYKPNYSRDFRRKLKDIKVEQNINRIAMLIAKRVAIFLLVALLSFSTVMAVNAQAREKVFGWIIETFPKFSIFTSQNIDGNIDLVELSSLKINYIPAGFDLVDTNIGRKMLIYNYSDKNNDKLTIFFAQSGDGKSYLDTENAEIKEFTFKGYGAYIWQTDEITYLLWYQDGVECRISGNLSKDEIIKIAENISK